jgi:DNA-binding transcriptional MerR regulator
MDWDDRLDAWQDELAELMDASDWVTLDEASRRAGVSRAALRTWYRRGEIPSRLLDGPHGPQRLVPLAMVTARAAASPRLRRNTERQLDAEAQLAILHQRIDQLELRIAALERERPGRSG